MTTVTTDTVRLGDVLDVDNLHRRIAERYIDHKHSGDGLNILDYSRFAQFDQVWDHETMTCRGFIAADDQNGAISADSIVVARPYAKFFTTSQHDALAEAGTIDPLPYGEPFELFTKEDGSMGVAYRNIQGRPAISTRGSFFSPQAQWANAYLAEHPEYAAALDALLELGTPCMEIICPDSQIVKIYTEQGLILHGLINRADGTDVPFTPSQWPGKIAARHDGLDIAAAAQLDWPNEEGFVVRFASGVRAKVKFDTYARLHRIVTGLTTLNLWENLAVAALRDSGTMTARQCVARLGIDHRLVASLFESGNDPIAEVLDRVPDEFDAWVRTHVASFREQYAAAEARYRELYQSLPFKDDRKSFAAYVKANLPRRDADVMFLFVSGQDYTAALWKDVQPKTGAAFTVDIDA